MRAECSVRSIGRGQRLVVVADDASHVPRAVGEAPQVHEARGAGAGVRIGGAEAMFAELKNVPNKSWNVGGEFRWKL